MGMFTACEIANIRKALGMSLTEFAYKIGVSAHTVMSWEADRRHPKFDHMAKINELSATVVKSNGRKKVLA